MRRVWKKLALGVGVVVLAMMAIPVVAGAASAGDISGSTLTKTSGPDCYQPGTAVLCFEVRHNGSGEEKLDTIQVRFPEEWAIEVNSLDESTFCGDTSSITPICKIKNSLLDCFC